MGWASKHIAALAKEETVTFRPRGNSMAGKIESGQLCTVEPYETDNDIEEGHIVLCKVKGNEYLHLVSAVKRDHGGLLFQISNNKKHVNGWIRPKYIYGRCTRIED